MTTLVLATRNRHKLEEIQAVLGPGIDYRTLADYEGAPAVQEDADSFAGNAAKKAAAVAAWLTTTRPGTIGVRVFALADDSGLEVDALGGAPGVRSARFAALDPGETGNSSDTANNTKLLRLLQEVPMERRTARFRCVLALAHVPHDLPPAADRQEVAARLRAEARLFEGACEGHILRAPRGSAGFGYDPLFQPCGYAQTFAELGPALKNTMSHRARALAKLHDCLRQGPTDDFWPAPGPG
jgi:XTP/dITP diphosphohydrolase